ncbi:tandem-95 repeat protein [Aliikangiella marina]|uniref:Tandem-95 repeat protein n=1 Tax=Aliikangiella marina TaxID=1712262 RepID=A0A545TJ13_9GAMM|nr:Ig-like domain-containing protein [Aliikangiella marina]TQV77224.1 tandem-95 repeat protein [Aliikangiella marina]
MKVKITSKLIAIFCYLFFAIISTNGNKLLAASCELYPITVSNQLVSNSLDGDIFSQVAVGVGTGNYSWLTWDGKNDAPSLADSLLIPGNSDLYINPYDSGDTELSPGDWVQGRPGVKNSSTIRSNLNVLLNRPIQIPIWSNKLGQGSQFNYQTISFATIELTEYKLNGKGWISFIYRGPAECDANSPPVAENSSIEGIENTEITIEFLATDADNDVLSYVIVTPPENGDLIGQGPVYTYTPFTDFTGSEIIEFIANDGTSDSNIGTVTITVSPEQNAPPIAFNTSLETTESTSFTFTVNVTDADNDPLDYIVVSDTNNGLLVGNSDIGTGPNYTYTPNAGFLGTDTFQFKANDGKTDSNIATVSIMVVPFANNPPVAFDANLETTESIAFDVLVNAEDADNDPLTYQIIQPPMSGTLLGDGPNYVYTPNSGFVGSDSFSFIVDDGQDSSNEATVTIQVNPAANNPPVAQNTAVETDESTTANITLLATDADNDPLTYQIVDNAQNGLLEGNGTDYIYTPNPGFFGEDSFTFIASDGIDDSELATVTIFVLEAVNSPPQIVPADYGVEQFFEIEFMVEAFDPDDDPLTYIIVQQPSNGTIEGNGPNYIYRPDDFFTGEDEMLIKVNDGTVDSETVAITFFVFDGGE